MNKSTRNLLRLASVIVVILLVLIQFQILPDVFNQGFEFWVLLLAYATLLFTLKK